MDSFWWEIFIILHNKLKSHNRAISRRIHFNPLSVIVKVKRLFSFYIIQYSTITHLTAEKNVSNWIICVGSLTTPCMGDEMRYTGKPAKTRSVADGQSQHSFSNHSGRYLTGNAFSAGLVNSRPGNTIDAITQAKWKWRSLFSTPTLCVKCKVIACK